MPHPRSLAIAALVCASAAPGLTAQERVDLLTIARIKEEGFQRSQVLATALGLSDGIGPRLAGSPGYDSAAAWAVRRLSGWGVGKATLEPWGKRGPSWVLDDHSLQMLAPEPLRLNAMPKARSQNTLGLIRGRAVLVAISEEKDFSTWHGKLRGAVVLNGNAFPARGRFDPSARRFTDAALDSMATLTDPGSPRTYWDDNDPWERTLARASRVTAFLKREGALAVIEPSGGPAVTADGYHTYVRSSRDNLPAFIVAQDHFDRLVALLKGGAKLELAANIKGRFIQGDSLGYNVIAEIAGGDPALAGEVVMLGGHLDSWHPGTGAADNAAGCAIVMEAMRILTAIGAKPRRTIRLALWDGEEQEEYFGSLGYVRQHFGDPVSLRLEPEHERLSAYFNVDQGSGRIRGLYLQGNEAVRPIFAALLEPFQYLGASTLTIASTGETDHMPFVAVGLPGFTFIQDPLDYFSRVARVHHSNLDTGRYLLEDDLKQAAVVLAGVVYGTAMRDQRLPRAPLPAARGK